jgi:hypothetical protein
MDSVTLKTILDVGRQFITKGFEQSPSSQSVYGYLVALLFVMVVVAEIRAWFERRDAKRYREQRDKEDREYRDRQDSRRNREWKEAEDKRELAREKLIQHFSAESTQSREFFANELDEIEKAVNDTLKAQGGDIKAHDKELSRLSGEINLLKQLHQQK